MNYARYYHEAVIADFPVYTLKQFDFPAANLSLHHGHEISVIGADPFDRKKHFFGVTVPELVEKARNGNVVLSDKEIEFINNFSKDSNIDMQAVILTHGRILLVDYEVHSVAVHGDRTIYDVKIVEDGQFVGLYRMVSWQYKKLLEVVESGKDTRKAIVGRFIKRDGDNLTLYRNWGIYTITVQELYKIVDCINTIENEIRSKDWAIKAKKDYK